ncbi:MAG: hypothetical protein V1876_00470 [Candidatus Peregrinibacteria bacterium]
MKIRDFQTFHQELAAETDPDVMWHTYGMYDNVTLLLNVQDPQMLAVEEMLESTYPKFEGQHDFFLNLMLFRARGYVHGALGSFRYHVGNGGALANRFRQLARRKFPTEACISFHGASPDQTLAGNIRTTRDSVVDVASRLMQMDVHFALNDPPAVFKPGKK